VAKKAAKATGGHANFVINFCQILFEANSRKLSLEESHMRVSDDRYTRDRQRFDLALRLIHHEARTRTIKQCTGLSDDRIRKLYRSYCLEEAGAALRHRGKSPRQAAFFFKNAEVNFQAAQLASLYVMYGLVHAADSGIAPAYRAGSLHAGTLLCRAYETYRQLHAPAGISFEHAWFLLTALARRDEVGIVRCRGCGGVQLHDLLAKYQLACGNCGAIPAWLAGGRARGPEAGMPC
jgi:hypothetical protein